MNLKLHSQLSLKAGFSLSSSRSSNIILVRHAQSIFNALCHKYSQQQVYGKQAQQQFHFNPQILDCSITQTGFKSANSQKIVNFFKNKSKNNTMFFVSPMLRALQTTQGILDSIGKDYRVKVIPQLTQILSKICDFSSGIKNKKNQFSTFDFEYFDKWIIQNGLSDSSQNWQDHFLDIKIRQKLGVQTDAQKRYIEILKNAFPNKVEDIQRCQQRSIQGFLKIYEISRNLNITNTVIVSHNRILKNIQKYIVGKQVKDFQNLQIRSLKLNEQQKQQI